MIDKLQYITTVINDVEVKYPIAFSLNVMEQVQDEYESMDNWANALKPKSGEPKFKDIIWTFKAFINEGIDIENENTDDVKPFLTHKQVGRLITHIGVGDVNKMISDMMIKSTKSKSKSPNAKTKQSPKNQQ